MNKGVSNIGRTNKVDTPPAPPAPTVTGARSGTSLSGTFVELGGALTPLLHNTVIEMGLFDFLIEDGFNEYLFFDRSAAYAILGDQTQAAMVRTDQANAQVAIGDVNGSINGTYLTVDEQGQLFSFQNNANNYLLFDTSARLYQMGDIDNANNQSTIDIKDASQAIQLNAGLSPSFIALAGAPGAESFVVNMAANPYLSLNPVTGRYLIGDIGGLGNNTIIDIADQTQTVTISSTANNMLSLDKSAGVYLIGDISNSLTGTRLDINDAVQYIQTQSAGAVNGLQIDFANLLFQIGDFFGTGNQNFIAVDDSAQTFYSQDGTGRQGLYIDYNNKIYQLGDLNVDSCGILVNGTSNKMSFNAPSGAGVNGFPTLSPFAVAGLANFANNAAAVVGGLAVGDFYRISVAGTSAVAVVQ